MLILSFISIFLGLFGSSADPSYEKEILDPIDGEQAAVTTTTAVFTYYATNRNNTHASNELLFVVLGVVLGIMILGLCVVMVMCACKQHQQRRLFGNCWMFFASNVLNYWFLSECIVNSGLSGFMINFVSSIVALPFAVNVIDVFLVFVAFIAFPLYCE